MNGEDQNLRLRANLQDLTRRLDSIEFRHADVEDRHVRLQLLGKAHRIAPGRGLRATFVFGNAGNQVADAVPDNLVIVSDQDSFFRLGHDGRCRQ